MKSSIQRVAIFFAALVSMYLIGAFMSWQLNPGKWKDEGRAVWTILSVVIAIVVSLTDFKKAYPEQ